MARRAETALTLCLLRHAKSSWDDAALDDHERPLAERGARDAARIGTWMADAGLVPDLVLCSDAVRTRATLALVLSALADVAPQIATEPGLYLAAAEAMTARLQAVEGARTVLMIGHNPGIHALALDLIGSGETKALAHLAMKYPTAALAVLRFEGATAWRDIAAGRGRLVHFVTPKSL
jgi:phosphohistidine phosphatase